VARGGSDKQVLRAAQMAADDELSKESESQLAEAAALRVFRAGEHARLLALPALTLSLKIRANPDVGWASRRVEDVVCRGGGEVGNELTGVFPQRS
jgi:hypothetical protein